MAITPILPELNQERDPEVDRIFVLGYVIKIDAEFENMIVGQFNPKLISEVKRFTREGFAVVIRVSYKDGSEERIKLIRAGSQQEDPSSIKH